MQSPENPLTLPLDYAAELAMEIHLMRGECSEAASKLLEEESSNAEAIEECALLDEALARAQVVMRAAVARIRDARETRFKKRK